MQELSETYEGKLAAAREVEERLLQKLSLLDGGRTAMERERERWIAHLHDTSIRRMQNASLARGWAAWLSAYEEARAGMQLLRAATSRLRRPALSAAFDHWWEDYRTTQEAIEEQLHQQSVEQLKLKVRA